MGGCDVERYWEVERSKVDVLLSYDSRTSCVNGHLP
jgi:hypothetical protein